MRRTHAVTFPLRYLFRHLDGAGGVVAAPAQLGIGVMAALTFSMETWETKQRKPQAHPSTLLSKLSIFVGMNLMIRDDVLISLLYDHDLGGQSYNNSMHCTGQSSVGFRLCLL